MKRYLILFVFLCLVLSSCQAEKTQNNTSVETPDTGSEKEPTQTEADSLLENLLLVDRTESSFLLADNSADHPGAVYTVGANTNLKVTVDGQTATVRDLKNGMILRIHYQGAIAESFPMQISDITEIEAKTLPKEEFPDLCGFYLKVLDDLWQEDTALNGTIVGFDFSQLPGNLSPSAQSALAIRFAEIHQVNTVLGNRDSLKQDGYLSEDGWKEGCLITIQPSNEASINENGILNFEVTKWKSPKGALYWMDCAAEWTSSESYPSYTIARKAAS